MIAADAPSRESDAHAEVRVKEQGKAYEEKKPASKSFRMRLKSVIAQLKKTS